MAHNAGVVAGAGWTVTLVFYRILQCYKANYVEKDGKPVNSTIQYSGPADSDHCPVLNYTVLYV
jgi:hypothetical protein